MRDTSATLVLPGKIPEQKELDHLLDRAERTIVAVDGGYDYLYPRSVIPDTLIGDMDTISPDAVIPDSVKVIRLNRRKDMTDLEAALRLCQEKKMTDIAILGGTEGPRVDMILNNISICAGFALSGLRITVFGSQRIDMLAPGQSISIEKGRFSVISILNNSEVSIESASYDYSGTLVSISSLGISNETLPEEAATVRCLSGCLAIFSEINPS